ncbi:hypothetical protein DFH07DRAFT_942596 [Mycena maculata]|uniref:Uncharacterized protein n=1 Tax=Mycena maculata TaxID=230809 RepID=A0AAD7IMQ7_9AGAR|nr:hypothetical protein DFH07DRAFT_942596 [Mycena maculata]
MATADKSPEVYEQLHKALVTLFSFVDFTEPSDSNMDKIFSFIAPCMGMDHSSMKETWRRRSGNNSRLIADLKRATIDGRGLDYSFLFDQCSVNTLPPEEADRIISSYLDEIRSALQSFIRNPEPLPLWVPDEDLPHAEFLKGLRIPASSTNAPDMLLHDLGNFKRNESLLKLIKTLFHSGTLARKSANGGTILLNTSGSGKTRTVLEGLCLLWGLYFTCQVDTEGRGSIDLQRTINTRIGKDPCFQRDLSIGTDAEARKVNETNGDIAGGRFAEVLLARLCILEFFCKVARNESGRLTDEHKKLWVFLQAQPSCIEQQGDIFNVLTERIIGIDKEHRTALIDEKINGLSAMNDTKTLFCVVDEAQVAATSFMGAFMTSDSSKTTARPILRELARAFAVQDTPITVNLTGTAINKTLVLDVMTSNIFKGPGITTVTHFGAFDVAEQQITYMKQFLPTQLAESVAFCKLFKRVSYWLKGRYRFTAAYMKDLLCTGFQRPHRMLNEFIRLSTVIPMPGNAVLTMSTGFQPTDSQEDWEPGEAVPSELMHFSFDKLKKDPALESVIRRHTAKFCMRSEIDRLVAGPRHFDLVQCGFARYANNDVGNQKDAKVALDEPLALLALGEWLQICDLPLAELLRIDAARAVTEANGANGLEEYIALYLSAVFDNHTPLTDIFRFHKYIDPPDWAKKPAALVSLYTEDDIEKDGDRVAMAEGRVQHHMRPSVTIGKDASTIEATKEWLRHTDRAPICFPDKFIGPDLLFILRLHDEEKSLIWVALQSKFSGANVLDKSVIEGALPTVTPAQFYGLRKEAAVATTEEEQENEQRRKDTRDQHQQDALRLLDLLPRRLRTPVQRGRKPVDAREKIIRRLTAKAAEDAQKVKGKNTQNRRLGELREKGKPSEVTRHSGRLAAKEDALQVQIELTGDEKALLQGAGKHSVLRVVVAWPAETSLHERAVNLPVYFDEENHPVVELNIEHWANTMARLHASAGNYIADVWKGKKRHPLEEHEDAPARKRANIGGSAIPTAVFHQRTVEEVLHLPPPQAPRALPQSPTDDEYSLAGFNTSVYTRATSPPPSTALSVYSRQDSPDDTMWRVGEGQDTAAES